jgi:hypothetical protein
VDQAVGGLPLLLFGVPSDEPGTQLALAVADPVRATDAPIPVAVELLSGWLLTPAVLVLDERHEELDVLVAHRYSL